MTKPKQIPLEITIAIDLIAKFLAQHEYLEAIITKDNQAFLRWKASFHDHSHQIQ